MLESILKKAQQFSDKEEQLHFLAREIYWTLPEMFEKGRFEPAGIDIHYENGLQHIYAWELSQNIARKLLGLEVQKAKGNTWDDAQRRAGYIQ